MCKYRDLQGGEFAVVGDLAMPVCVCSSGQMF